jgi:UDP-glucuronate decarboxylase
VICLDNFFTGSRQNIEHLMANERFTVVDHDVELPFNYPVDRIYNLACPAAPVWYQKDPVKTIRTCVLGAANMLELAKKYGARILQTSTSEVYGDPEVHPQPETYVGHVNPIGPRSCYDEGKRCAESMFMNYHREHNVDVCLVRIFNTYGPRMAVDDGRVVSNFILQAIAGEDITIYGQGQQTRSFCYVDDLVSGLIAAMDKPGFTGPVNLGNPREFTISQLADLTLKFIPGSSSHIVHRDLPLDDPKQRKPDISLAKQELGWEPTVQLEEGLKLVIDYFKNK